ILCSGCAAGMRDVPGVHFEWFNLGTNDIWVTDVKGLQPDAAPGLLIPTRTESQLKTKESVFWETVRITDSITIVWKDNGKQGFPGGRGPSGFTRLPGTLRETKINRASVGIPKTLNGGKIRFSYLGGDQWRIRFFTDPDAGYDR